MNTATNQTTDADFNITDRRPALTFRESDEGRTHTVYANGHRIGILRKIADDLWRLTGTSEHRATRDEAAELLLAVYCAARDAQSIPLTDSAFEQGFVRMERIGRRALEQGTLDRADVLDLFSAVHGMLQGALGDGQVRRARDLFEDFTREARARVDEPDELILSLRKGDDR